MIGIGGEGTSRSTACSGLKEEICRKKKNGTDPGEEGTKSGKRGAERGVN